MEVYDFFFDTHAELAITRRNLPHWEQTGKIYFVTWRLADSLPVIKLEQWKEERREWARRHAGKKLKDLLPGERRQYYELFHGRIQQWLDAGSGSCILGQEIPQRIVVNAFHHFDGLRYRLGTFAVAANHVHVLVLPMNGVELPTIVHSWKSFTSNTINASIGRKGKFWMDENYDHLVRNEHSLERIESYIIRHAERGAHVELRPYTS
jgi:hypothetical protein